MGATQRYYNLAARRMLGLVNDVRNNQTIVCYQSQNSKRKAADASLDLLARVSAQSRERIFSESDQTDKLDAPQLPTLKEDDDNESRV